VIIADPGCATLGGTPGVTDTHVPACYFNFVPFDNLVEEQEQYQSYLEYNLDLGESTRFHVAGFYSQTDVPQYRTSPSFLASQVPTTGASPGQTTIPGRFSVPSSNPGVLNFVAQNPALVRNLPAAAQANLNDPAGILINLNPLFRPFGVGGNPATGSTNFGTRTADAFRLTASLNGQLARTSKWDVGVTYMENGYLSTNQDIPVTRLQAALQGFGGFNCTGTIPGRNGCLYYNPFSSAIVKNIIDGQVNPNFVASSANSAELARFLFASALRRLWRQRRRYLRSKTVGSMAGHRLAGTARLGRYFFPRAADQHPDTQFGHCAGILAAGRRFQGSPSVR